jgi:hypothetical protein
MELVHLVLECLRQVEEMELLAAREFQNMTQDAIQREDDLCHPLPVNASVAKLPSCVY